MSNSEVKSLTPKEALEYCNNGATIVDIREDYLTAYKYFDVKSIVNIPFEDLEKRIDELKELKTLIISDSAGIVSKKACDELKRNGFNEVYNLSGGLIEWERDGLPLTEDIDERLNGACACQLKPREARKFKD